MSRPQRYTLNGGNSLHIAGVRVALRLRTLAESCPIGATMKSRFRFLHLVGVILLSAALVASLTSCAEAEPVVIATDGNYRPLQLHK